MEKINRNDKVKAMLIIGSLVVIFFYALINYFDYSRAKKIEQINSNFRITKGIVIQRNLYKGHSILVKYFVKDKEYIGSDGLNGSFEIGDSILVKYLATNPSEMITECTFKTNGDVIISKKGLDFFGYVKSILFMLFIAYFATKLQSSKINNSFGFRRKNKKVNKRLNCL